ncbi:assimilatory nitrate reductase catalytic subunit NasC [Salibacterium qingdaonense]|uniref:Assimilatory nitrate reductase catalytic subunit n=1 Tax=Salibacterium qingdaonense TaxID=266892 RepID=A0A1I4LLG5_9BACI|nr:molybdopterin oxidoreductase family protein [Salibacterium qingdaonense]SFL91731.1 assimilatory nitrate reductase catalytic subunit [Salibacterium qingdaonense]
MSNQMLATFRSRQQSVGTERVYHTQCPFCSMQCKKKVLEEKQGSRLRYRTIGVDNPTTKGRLCVKGKNAYQHAVHPERITTPLIKVDGEFQKAGWDEALDLIGKNFREVQEARDKDAVSLYGGGSLTNEEAYLLGKLARVGLGTKYVDYNGRFCMSSAASASTKTFGLDRGFTNHIDQIPDAKCIILAGTNIAECQPTFVPYLEEARQNGSFLIVMDPRETDTAAMADLHLKVKPGQDKQLALLMEHYIVQHGLQDDAFCREQTAGYDDLLARLAEVNPVKDAAETGLRLEDIEEAAYRFASAPTGMILTARGIEQQVDGHDTVRHFLHLLLLTGKIGKYACGYGAVTGQANGQGGREHGQKADQLPGYRSIENSEHRRWIAEVWGVQEPDLPGKGVSAYEMMERMEEGEIQALLLIGSNPVVSNPNANLVHRAFSSVSFMVVAEMFMTESAAYADVIFPTSSYLEDEGTLTNLEGRVTLREASKELPGQCRHDWQIMMAVAEVMGKGDYFSYEKAEDIFNELRLASRGGKADYYGISYDRIRRQSGVFWPCPSEDADEAETLFTNSFATEDGRAHFLTEPTAEEGAKETVDAAYPLYLTTGRTMSHYLTGEQTRRSSRLAAREFESYVEVHPDTARDHGVRSGELVTLASRRGTAVLRCVVSGDVRRDTLFAPMHWGGRQNINRLIDRTLDPACRMPGFKRTAVSLHPAAGG